MDVINGAKFYHNRLRGLDIVGGQILTIPTDAAMSPLTV